MHRSHAPTVMIIRCCTALNVVRTLQRNIRPDLSIEQLWDIIGHQPFPSQLERDLVFALPQSRNEIKVLFPLDSPCVACPAEVMSANQGTGPHPYATCAE